MPNVFSGKRDVYLEVAERYERFIRLGILKDGDRLPSVRTAAGELGINPNTVQKAYGLLEEKGLICSLPKKGVFVTFPSESDDKRISLIREIKDALRAFKEQGVAQSDLIEIIEEVYNND